MPHLVRWHEEMSDYGLVIIGSHVQQGSAAQVRAKAASLGVTFAVSSQTRVKDGNDFSGIPHCMLFDHTGKCLYRGSPAGVEKDLRLALGKALVAGIDKPGKAIASSVEALARGQSPGPILRRTIPLLTPAGSPVAEEAKKLVEALTSAGQKRLEEAQAIKGDDPLGAYGLIEKVPVTFRGTPVAARAAELLAELRKDSALQAELKARPSLEAVRKIDGYLTDVAQKARIEDLKDPKFQKALSPQLARLRRSLQDMAKAYPEAKATQEALAIGEKYGIDVK
jgi:hypothetical protein